MKVLMIVSWYSPKTAETMFAGVFHYEQSMALQKYGEVALYFPYDTALEEGFSKEVEKGLLTYRRRIPSKHIPKISALIARINWTRDLKRICKEFNPDIIHAHCAAAAGKIAVNFGKKYGYPVIITEHSPVEQLGLDNPLEKNSIEMVYSQSAANISVSKHSAECLKSNFPNCDFEVIYNGIYSPDFVGIDNNNYRINGKINACIVAGFYSKEIKGYQHLLPAVAELKKQGMDIVLHICGDGEYFDYYRNIARDLGIENGCIFYGNCTKQKVYSVISQMDFGISASLFESAGVSVEEALLLGKPMLVTRSGGANSLVNEDVAIVVDKGSNQALVEGIKRMVERLSDFDESVIKNYAFNNFEIDQISRKYMKLYESLKSQKG